jgi:hypothetical protein
MTPVRPSARRDFLNATDIVMADIYEGEPGGDPAGPCCHGQACHSDAPSFYFVGRNANEI